MYKDAAGGALFEYYTYLYIIRQRKKIPVSAMKPGFLRI
jgi:hypothetical protein